MGARDDSKATPKSILRNLRNSLLFTENPESTWLQRERRNYGSATDRTPLPTLL